MDDAVEGGVERAVEGLCDLEPQAFVPRVGVRVLVGSRRPVAGREHVPHVEGPEAVAG